MYTCSICEETEALGSVLKSCCDSCPSTLRGKEPKKRNFPLSVCVVWIICFYGFTDE